MDLLSFERKLDSTIMRKRLDIQEALKRPMKQKRKLRVFISNTAFPAKEEDQVGGGGGGSSPGDAEGSSARGGRARGRDPKQVEAHRAPGPERPGHSGRRIRRAAA